MLLHLPKIIFLFVFVGTKAHPCQSITRRRQCTVSEKCLWLPNATRCVGKEQIMCEDLKAKRVCLKLEGCSWNGKDKCFTRQASENCPVIPDCTKVSCLPMRCEEDTVPFKPHGQCCPTKCVTKQNCALVRCADPLCGDDEVKVLGDGGCCFVCEKTCPCPEVSLSPPCIEVYFPMDCDGCMYTNSCFAARAGLDTETQCKPAFCAQDQDCDKSSGEICYDGFDEDCDVDCKDRSCRAKCAVADTTVTCGGFAGAVCPEGFECLDKKGDKCSPLCGGVDCAGVCIEECPRPKIVKCTKILKRVQCGRCTYSNQCLASSAGFKERQCRPSRVPLG